MSIAWHTEYFARQKNLKPLKKYLEMGRPQKPQTGADVLAVFKEFQARGAPLKIRRITKSS